MNTDITNGTTAASVTAFTGTETAPAGFRVVSLHWKSRKATDTTPAVAKRDSVAVIVPSITVEALEPVALLEAVQDAINELQDECIRALVEKGAVQIPHDACNAVAVAAYAASTASSKRLNKQGIYAWFDAGLMDTVTAKVNAALSIGPNATDIQIKDVIAKTEAFRAKYALLANPVPAINKQTAQQLLTLAQQSKVTDSAVHDSIIAKLTLITTKQDAELLNINI